MYEKIKSSSRTFFIDILFIFFLYCINITSFYCSQSSSNYLHIVVIYIFNVDLKFFKEVYKKKENLYRMIHENLHVPLKVIQLNNYIRVILLNQKQKGLKFLRLYVKEL